MLTVQYILLVHNPCNGKAGRLALKNACIIFICQISV